MQSNQIRTTIYLDKDLFFEAKRKALEERTTFTNLVKRGLESQIITKDMSNDDEYDILKLEGVFKTKKKVPFKKVREAFGNYLARRHLRSYR